MEKILLFDIDGTLLLTGGCGKVAFEKAFEELFGILNCWGNTVPDGKTDPIIIEEIVQNHLKSTLEGDKHKLLCERYIYHFRNEIKNPPCLRLMPGVSELLTELSKKNGFFLGIATGNLEEAGWLKLEAGKIREFFQFGGFGSDSHLRSEIVKAAIKQGEKILGHSIPRNQIYVIGDTIYDVRSAKETGCHSIGVCTGSKKEAEFEFEKPDYLLRDLTNIPEFLKIIC